MNPDNTELLKQINTPADLRKLQVSEQAFHYQYSRP